MNIPFTIRSPMNLPLGHPWVVTSWNSLCNVALIFWKMYSCMIPTSSLYVSVILNIMTDAHKDSPSQRMGNVVLLAYGYGWKLAETISSLLELELELGSIKLYTARTRARHELGSFLWCISEKLKPDSSSAHNISILSYLLSLLQISLISSLIIQCITYYIRFNY